MSKRLLTAGIVLICLSAVLPLALTGGDAQEPPKVKEGKNEKAVKVLKLSGAAQTYVEALLEGVRLAPISFEDKELYARFATADSILDFLVPVYLEKYSEEELDAMVEFYSSPMGQSIVRKSLPVVLELRKASLQWGMRISDKVKSEKGRTSDDKGK